MNNISFEVYFKEITQLIEEIANNNGMKVKFSIFNGEKEVFDLNKFFLNNVCPHFNLPEGFLLYLISNSDNYPVCTFIIRGNINSPYYVHISANAKSDLGFYNELFFSEKVNPSEYESDNVYFTNELFKLKEKLCKQIGLTIEMDKR